MISCSTSMVVLKLTDFDIRNIPGSLKKLTPKLMKLTLNEYPMPFLKGEDTMSKKKKTTKKGFMPMFPDMSAMPAMPMPPMPFMPFGKKGCEKEETKEQWGDFKSNMENFWDQIRDMQNSSMEASKEQWNTFFGQCLDMEEIFIASLPDEVPTLPWLPAWLTPSMSPQAFMSKVKAFQEMANEHAVEQAATFLDFCKKGQEQVKEAVTEAVENVEAKVEKEAEAKAEKEAEAAPEEPAKE